MKRSLERPMLTSHIQYHATIIPND